ncbi:Thiol-disulfide isomerase or thioredoxin [Catalinimonas alkaloidigena]|uniref:Thiol-disulfide isomerase or thioredoxin n=1 Tax=Catalinimonas alkaloidigena TaxID=1075417 RepID=A0A1G9UBI9_9BACT|nr:TlpA disulfide reductase family protein [Catalinimonas alkaloidigena]SDM57278.1 Thiol-disulfide isomerase or thioredoxin [Catalinimonas alkaloidigena]
MTRKKPLRFFLDWLLLPTVILVLYLSGWLPEVQGFVQRGVLATGLFNPTTEQEAAPAAYDLALVPFAGGPAASLQQWRGKTIFLNFWASWCPPCVAEMPDIQQLYETMGDEVVFVLVDLDEDRAKAERFLARKGYTFPVYRLAGSLPAAYASNSIPTTYVISPDGEIRWRHAGMAQYNTDQFQQFLRTLEDDAQDHPR